MEKPGILSEASANVTLSKADFVYLQNLVCSYHLLNKKIIVAVCDATKVNSSDADGQIKKS